MTENRSQWCRMDVRRLASSSMKVKFTNSCSLSCYATLTMGLEAQRNLSCSNHFGCRHRYTLARERHSHTIFRISAAVTHCSRPIVTTFELGFGFEAATCPTGAVSEGAQLGVPASNLPLPEQSFVRSIYPLLAALPSLPSQPSTLPGHGSWASPARVPVHTKGTRLLAMRRILLKGKSGGELLKFYFDH